MQPQGHLQVLVNLLDYGMDVQTAIDMPRADRRVVVEDGFPAATYDRLAWWKHEVIRRQGHHGFGAAAGHCNRQGRADRWRCARQGYRDIVTFALAIMDHLDHDPRMQDCVGG